ncbi:DUF397 domain-containing protein [Spirillospora sp. NPDC048911]|uniref:DUF397 domain-containing protein n=1 Tax=Spirillospora sp. NPDC048911 TaxID=3364527 RepID=UPI00371306F8
MTEWRKSSYSGGIDNSDCVELARFGHVIGLRDSKAPDAGHLVLPLETFAELVTRVKRAELDL